MPPEQTIAHFKRTYSRCQYNLLFGYIGSNIISEQSSDTDKESVWAFLHCVLSICCVKNS